MKVGILTYHRSYNFGANLQALAVQSALVTKGVSPVIVNYQEEEKMENYRKGVTPEQVQIHERFFSKYYVESPVFYHEEQVKQFCMDSLDAILVGSDAVFRLVPKYDPINISIWILKKTLQKKPSSNLNVTERVSPYWLNWEDSNRGKEIIKATIAASCMGTNFYFMPIKLRTDLRRCIERFHFISVRDQWTQKMIRFISSGDRISEICPDPVFALGENFSIPGDEYPQHDVSNTILISGRFSNRWVKAFVKQAHDWGYTVGNLANADTSFDYPEVDFGIPLPFSPLEWYLLLAKAAGYVGIRFHALVSCIANQTPVINVDNLSNSLVNRAGSKMYDLCKRAGIRKRYYTEKRINHTNPIRVMDDLFDAQSLENANRYAAYAQKQFSQVLDRIIQIIHLSPN